MALYGTRIGRALAPIAMAGFLACTLLAGCGRQEGGSANVEQTKPPPAPATPDPHGAVVQSAKTELRLHQPFAEATIADLPDQYLPDKTLAGKSVGKLYEDVVRRWDQVIFLTAAGQKLHYSAILETDLGSIEIELQPELAPNHVRNFVALAQSGYFDKLVFERVVNEQSEAQPEHKVELIEGACPTGTGNPGHGSIGYWLKPEFSKDVQHDIGTVGACRGEDPASAACRFYITLSKAPVMDGERTIFGKVSQGLDVVRRIATQPVMNSPEYPLGDRPEKPVVMRKVTIKVTPTPSSVARKAP